MESLKFAKPTKKAKAPRPLRRKTPIRAKRWGIKAKRVRRLTGRDPEIVALFEEMTALGGDFASKERAVPRPEYVEWIHTQTCAFARYLPGHVCRGDRIVMCHEAKKKGMSLKSPDELAFPGCSGGHDEWTAASGEFKHWKKARRRAFADEVGPSEYARFLSSGSRRGS